MSDPKLTNRLDAAIFVAVAVLLITLIVLLVANLSIQYSNYREGIGFALADPKYIDHASVIAYSRAWDFAVVKTSAIFLSYVLIFTGALYVLRAGETNFELKAENADFKAALSMTSPGLVMVTLGVLLTMFVLSTKTYVSYDRQGLESPQEIRPSQKPSRSMKPVGAPETTVRRKK